MTAPLTAVAPKPIGLRPAVVAIAAAGSASSGAHSWWRSFWTDRCG